MGSITVGGSMRGPRSSNNNINGGPYVTQVQIQQQKQKHYQQSLNGSNYGTSSGGSNGQQKMPPASKV